MIIFFPALIIVVSGGFHLSITFLSSTDTQFKHALTLGRHVNNLPGLYHRLATLLHSHSSKTFTHLLPKKLRTHNCIQKHNKTHSHTREELWTQKSVFTYIIWKLTGGGRQQTIIPGARGGKNRRLWKQIRVMSSKLNGKPCVRKTGESIHIYCCQDFNINIIETTSDVSLSTDWLTKRRTNCQLYLMKMKIQQKG